MGFHFPPPSVPAAPGGPTDAQLALVRGLVAPSVLVMAADGAVASTERRELIGALRFNGVLRDVGAETVVSVAETMLEEIRARFGVATLSACTEALSPELRETAICMAVRIAMSDGVLDDDEHTVLVDLAMSLGIAPEAYNAMVEVMSILQRPA